jgi:molybdopterin-guanine dinucleotide biosynthesis protein A
MIAAILAGGKSRRMGQDKTFLEFNGVPMIHRVINAIKPYIDDMVIIANDPEERLLDIGIPVHEDKIRGMGPLSGLYTAFEVTGATQLLLAACDMPMIKPEIIELLISYPDWRGDALIPVADGREQGLLAIYRRGAIEKVREKIESQSIQFDEFRIGLEKTLIDEEKIKLLNPDFQSFMNMNRPEDFT